MKNKQKVDRVFFFFFFLVKQIHNVDVITIPNFCIKHIYAFNKIELYNMRKKIKYYYYIFHLELLHQSKRLYAILPRSNTSCFKTISTTNFYFIQINFIAALFSKTYLHCIVKNKITNIVIYCYLYAPLLFNM